MYGGSLGDLRAARAACGLPIIPANDLGDAAKKIVAEVKAPVAA